MEKSMGNQITKKENNGFTLAELLIVVAMIGVLVAISIPIFAEQLEKSRESTDFANVRGAYAEVMTAVMAEDTASTLYYANDDSYRKKVQLRQKKDGWSTSMDDIVIGGVSYQDKGNHWLNDPKANGICEVYYKSGAVFINWLGKQDHINTISAKDFLTKEILLDILGEGYRHQILNSNEKDPNGGTKKFNDYAAANGFDLAEYQAKTWQIYVKESAGGAFLDDPAIYWSTLELTSDMVDSYIPVIGYRDGKYDVYRAQVRDGAGNDTGYPYITLQTFANVTNEGGRATFQFSTYDEALEAYHKLMDIYNTKNTIDYSDLSKNNLN